MPQGECNIIGALALSAVLDVGGRFTTAPGVSPAPRDTGSIIVVRPPMRRYCRTS